MSFDPDKLQHNEAIEDEQAINPSVVDEPILSPEEKQAKADELEKMRIESDKKDEEELANLRGKIEDIFAGKKDIEPPKKNGGEKSAEVKEREKSVEEALKEIDKFIGESRDLSQTDIEFAKNARNFVFRMSRPAETGNPKDLMYRPVQRMTEKVVPRIKVGLGNIEKYSQKQKLDNNKDKTEIEKLLHQIEQEENPGKVAEYTERASQLFDELVDQTNESRTDNKKERGHLCEMSDENNDDAKKELRLAERNLGRGGYGADIKNSMTGQYARASRTLAEFMAIESGKIDKNENAFQKSSEDRKKAFRRILENL